MLLFGLFRKESRVKRGWNWKLWVVWLDNVKGVATQLAAAFESVKGIAMPLTIADWPPWSVGALLSHDAASVSVLTVTDLPLAIDAD